MADLETEPEATISEKQEELIPPVEVSPGENFNLNITIKKTESFFAVILPMKGSYGQHPQAQERLKNYIQQKGIKPTGPYFGMYYSDAAKVPRPLYYWEVGCPVKAGTQVDPPFETRQIESSTVGTAILPDPTEIEYP